ncbi:MAG: GTP-binding protein [Clostridiales bacterium]|nr:GTP-binding protein [Clostridiales bacterium]
MTANNNVKKSIPVFLITGFLGSGKTTLLQNLLELYGDKKIGIIVNEFGKVTVDGALMQKEGVTLTEIANGSIFCSCLIGSFIDGLTAMAGMPIESLFIESSGLSDPSEMEKIMHDINPFVNGIYDYRGTICIVDATRHLELSQILETINRQVIYSHLIVINKSDLVDNERLKDLETSIRMQNPFAPIITTSYGKIDEIWLEQSLKDFPLPPSHSSLNTQANRPKTLVLETTGALERNSLRDFLQSFSEHTFRIKGFVELKEGWHYVDGVSDTIKFSPSKIRPDSSQITVILNTRQPVKKLIQGQWAKYFDNPLDIR